jgi:Sec-independent protein translocase protein TatA
MQFASLALYIERNSEMLPKFGPVELILILVIITMLFGAVGRGVREFRKNADAGDETATSSDDKPSTDPSAPAA